MFVDLSHKLISNISCGMEMIFAFGKNWNSWHLCLNLQQRQTLDQWKKDFQTDGSKIELFGTKKPENVLIILV